ncbi:ribonuclease H-like domain-containing protein [Tanacetum coccineum]
MVNTCESRNSKPLERNELSYHHYPIHPIPRSHIHALRDPQLNKAMGITVSAMTDLGSLNYFLGISAQRSSSGLFLSQSKFAKEILERAHMQHCDRFTLSRSRAEARVSRCFAMIVAETLRENEIAD